MIHTGDCLVILPTLEADSVDSIVTDPPAGIAFMSKHWDRDKGGRTQWVAWMTEVMRECYRVLKPGGYAVVWSLPRTCHWTAWAMEDAGFIIRDQLAHVFASGFPKGKAQLKPAREDWWLARKPGPLRPLAIDACRIGVDGGGTTCTNRDEDGNCLHRGDEDGRIRSGGQSWGTQHGPDTTAGRWPSNLLLSDPELFDEPNPYVVGSGAVANTGGAVSGGEHAPSGYPSFRTYRYEFDGYGDTGGYSRFFVIPKAARADREPVLRGQLEKGENVGVRYATMSGDDQPIKPVSRENSHPTVKPVDLMRHLIRLVTPPGGTILDPFLGSGSTAIAAEMEGFPWVGIEKEPEYVAIAEARLNGVQRGLGLDVPAPTRKRTLGEGTYPPGEPYSQNTILGPLKPDEAA